MMDNDGLKATVESDRSQSALELSLLWSGVSTQTIQTQLAENSKVKNLVNQVSHEINDNQTAISESLYYGNFLL